MGVTRKLIRLSAKSLAVVIPKAMLKKYGWKAKQKLSIKDSGGGKLEVRDWKSK